jgi:hypothetical protein
MDAFIRKPLAERTQAFVEAEARLGVPARVVEKDFWVCWTLRELFALPIHGSHLTFKGGTSLSKGWKLIDRFSEDVDLVLDRELLGFKEEKPGGKKLEKLRAACGARVTKELLPELRARLKERLPPDAKWEVSPAGGEEDPDEQTLLFAYPTVFPEAASYVRPAVKIELGARSEIEPAESPRIAPMLADAFDGLLADAAFAVRSLAPRRTFWEKAMLLHEETYRPPGKLRKARLSRHYYDLWCLITKGVAAEALKDEGLFERIASHRMVFFRYGWMDYDTLRKGRLRLLPLGEQEAEWRKDYAAMRGEMIFGAPPTFDEILRIVGEFEKEFNGSAANQS